MTASRRLDGHRRRRAGVGCGLESRDVHTALGAFNPSICQKRFYKGAARFQTGFLDAGNRLEEEGMVQEAVVRGTWHPDS